jgi:hypothetical protein
MKKRQPPDDGPPYLFPVELHSRKGGCSHGLVCEDLDPGQEEGHGSFLVGKFSFGVFHYGLQVRE